MNENKKMNKNRKKNKKEEKNNWRGKLNKDQLKKLEKKELYRGEKKRRVEYKCCFLYKKFKKKTSNINRILREYSWNNRETKMFFLKILA